MSAFHLCVSYVSTHTAIKRLICKWGNMLSYIIYQKASPELENRDTELNTAKVSPVYGIKWINNFAI